MRLVANIETDANEHRDDSHKEHGLNEESLTLSQTLPEAILAPFLPNDTT